MIQRGFLLRGTLRPTGVPVAKNTVVSGQTFTVIKPLNKIPPSITLRRSTGAR